jgi:hypothetical protein
MFDEIERRRKRREREKILERLPEPDTSPIFTEVRAYIHDRDNDLIRFKPEEAANIPVRDIFFDAKSTLIPYMGTLVAQFKILDDVCVSSHKSYLEGESDDITILTHAYSDRSKYADEIMRKLEQAKDLQLLERVDLQKELNDLRSTNASLQADLTKCREERSKFKTDLDGLRKITGFTSTVEGSQSGEKKQ